MMRRYALLKDPHALIGVQLVTSGGRGRAFAKSVREDRRSRRDVRAGDLIVAVNGTNVRGRGARVARVVELLHDVKPGDKVDLQVLRDGKTRDFMRDGPSGRAMIFRRAAHVPACRRCRADPACRE